MSLTSRLVVSAVATHTSVLDLSTVTDPLSYQYVVELANGTATGQADLIWHDTRTLTASATENIDLAGSLLDAFGATITFARVKALVVTAAAANTNNVRIGGAASNAWVNWVGNSSDIINVRPGGFFALAHGGTGFGVTAGTGDILLVANSGAGTSVTYDIIVIGASV